MLRGVQDQGRSRPALQPGAQGGGARPRAQAAPHAACHSSWRHGATIRQDVEGRRPAARGLRAQAPPADPGGLHPRVPARAEADMLLHGREGALREGALGVLHGAHDLSEAIIDTISSNCEENQSFQK